MVAQGGKDGSHRFGIRSRFGTLKHSTLADYLAVLGPEAFWSKTRLACVRNPWDRAVSFYFSPHKGRTGWNRAEFIRSLDLVHPMASYLRLPGDPPGVVPAANLDLLIRFERLQRDFDRVCDRLDIERHTVPLRNQSRRLPYMDYYDEELIRIVAERFSEDVSLFGYSFFDAAGQDP